MTDNPLGSHAEGRAAWRPQRKGDLWMQREGAQTAVYNPETARLHMLNASALAIWEACDGATRIEEIIGAIIEMTAINAEQVTAEVTDAIENLRQAGLVV